MDRRDWKLAAIAATQLQAVYAAFNRGTKNKRTYRCRTIPGCSHLLQSLEDAIQRKLIPSSTGRPPCSHLERDLSPSQLRWGERGPPILQPMQILNLRHLKKSLHRPLIDQIIHQDLYFQEDPTISRRNEVKKKKVNSAINLADNIYHHLPISKCKLMDCATESGASLWLLALPIEDITSPWARVLWELLCFYVMGETLPTSVPSVLVMLPLTWTMPRRPA